MLVEAAGLVEVVDVEGAPEVAGLLKHLRIPTEANGLATLTILPVVTDGQLAYCELWWTYRGLAGVVWLEKWRDLPGPGQVEALQSGAWEWDWESYLEGMVAYVVNEPPPRLSPGQRAASTLAVLADAVAVADAALETSARAIEEAARTGDATPLGSASEAEYLGELLTDPRAARWAAAPPPDVQQARRRGRPSLRGGPHEERTRLVADVSPSLLSEVDRVAAACGVARAEWVRRALTGAVAVHDRRAASKEGAAADESPATRDGEGAP
ncbi:hypothetical protein [Streptomyces sp. SM12]|uniref:hypothetical protein n=1 Tax=Streptomyces sp. SM12 TaxID=1071602 RepID=UPI000CD4E6DD|nr:hypothetical protein [Streptomyces sp. SM12]